MADPTPLVIYGAGDHGLVVAEAARLAGYDVRGFVDDNRAPGQMVGELPLLEGPGPDAALIVAIGDNATRLRIVDQLDLPPGRLATVVHPTAFLSPSATLGPGVFVGPNATIHAYATIERAAIINSAAVVEHHNHIGPAAHIAPNATLAGRVTVGQAALIGAGATVRPAVTIGPHAIVGAGSAVIHDVPAHETAAGVPARPIR